ncbi:MAG: T9SS type A sorting domain-containing protein [Cyclobacteriaceae bacterium]
MIRITTILLFLSALPLAAQQMVIKSGANLVISSGTHLVMQDISLNNEGAVDAEGSTLSFPTSTQLDLITDSEISASALVLDGAGGFVEVNGSVVVENLEITSNNNLTLIDESTLDVDVDYNVNGNLTLESGASLIIKPVADVLGDVTVYRNTTFDSNTGKYSIVGTPVLNTGFFSLGSEAQDWIFGYDETQEFSTDGLDRFVSPSGSLMQEGKGYFSAFTGDENGTIIFSGEPNPTNLMVAVTKTDHPTGEDDYEGFNLVSNPYTSPISFSQFANTNSSALAEETIWIWDDFASDAGGGDGSADYITINALGNTDSRGGRLADWDGTINVAQGFFVKANASGNVSFNHMMKTHDGNDDASFYRKQEEEIEKYWISIEGENGDIGGNTLIGFHPEATDGFDSKFDASKFNSSFSVYSLIEGQKFAIQGLSESWISQVHEDKQIPLGYEVLEEGQHSIGIQRSEYSSEVPLYLNDLENGTYFDLMQEDSYSFSTSVGAFDSRFVLSLAPLSFDEITSVDDIRDFIKVYGVDQSIRLDATQAGKLAIVSIDGKVLNQQVFSKGKTILKVPAIGVYLVTVTTDAGIFTEKVIVN